MHVSRLQSLFHKPMKQQIPAFMHDILVFKSAAHSDLSLRNPNDLHHHGANQVKFGTSSLDTWVLRYGIYFKSDC